MFYQYVLTIGKQPIQCNLLERTFWIKNQVISLVSCDFWTNPASISLICRGWERLPNTVLLRGKWFSHTLLAEIQNVTPIEDNLAPWIQVPTSGHFSISTSTWNNIQVYKRSSIYSSNYYIFTIYKIEIYIRPFKWRWQVGSWIYKSRAQRGPGWKYKCGSHQLTDYI